MKKKIFSKLTNRLNKINSESLSKVQILEEKFTKAIILADCKLYLAILAVIRQETSGFLSAGILFRRSWKIYAKTQRQLYNIYKKLEPNAEKIYGSDPNSNLIQLLIEDNDENDSNRNPSSKPEINELTITDDEAEGMSLETVKRLLGAVSYGYGLFQILLSFMPPNLLILIKLFGFEGDRGVALKAISFTSISKDMRAPFADMIILWYSTIISPFLNVTEADVNISEEDTKLVLEKNLAKYPSSFLFNYFQGRYYRTSLRDLDKSLACYKIAHENSKNIIEIRFISIYEIGLIYLMKLEYSKSLENFDILSKESQWSKSINSYICAIISGSMGDLMRANQYIKDAVNQRAAQTKKENPFEIFMMKRVEYFYKNPIDSKDFCDMFYVELLYLWICLPYCQDTHLKNMLAGN